MSIGFSKNNNLTTPHIYANNQGEIPIICSYVEDLFFTGNLSLKEFIKVTKEEFEMTYTHLLRYFLSSNVKIPNEGIFISQPKYLRDVFEEI